MAEVRVEDLLNVVVWRGGEPAGRIQEVVVRIHDGAWEVCEYHLGVYALMERLSASGFGRVLLDSLLPKSYTRSYRVPWNCMDLADPLRPRLTCPTEEMEWI